MSLRCLIVEDQVMFLQLLCTMLQGVRGLEVVATATSCHDGLLACRRHRPDILILDLALPDGDGLEVAREPHPLRPAAIVLRHDNLEQPAVLELINHLRNGIARMEHLPFARVGTVVDGHDLHPAAGHPDRSDAGTGQCRPQPQPRLASGAARSPGGTPQPA